MKHKKSQGVITCPKCNNQFMLLIVKKGKKGTFYACPWHCGWKSENPIVNGIVVDVWEGKFLSKKEVQELENE